MMQCMLDRIDRYNSAFSASAEDSECRLQAAALAAAVSLDVRPRPTATHFSADVQHLASRMWSSHAPDAMDDDEKEKARSVVRLYDLWRKATGEFNRHYLTNNTRLIAALRLQRRTGDTRSLKAVERARDVLDTQLLKITGNVDRKAQNLGMGSSPTYMLPYTVPEINRNDLLPQATPAYFQALLRVMEPGNGFVDVKGVRGPVWAPGEIA